MNILDCKLGAGETCTQCFLGQETAAFPLSKSLFHQIESQNVPANRLTLGIRPEAVRLSRQEKDGYVKTEVNAIEPLGPYDIVEIKIDGQRMRIKSATRFIEKPGDWIWIQLDEQRTHFFDKQNGKSLKINP